jgi:hypothetical protein
MMIHIEPAGDNDTNERFGVTGSMLSVKKQTREKERPL